MATEFEACRERAVSVYQEDAEGLRATLGKLKTEVSHVRRDFDDGKVTDASARSEPVGLLALELARGSVRNAPVNAGADIDGRWVALRTIARKSLRLGALLSTERLAAGKDVHALADEIAKMINAVDPAARLWP